MKKIFFFFILVSFAFAAHAQKTVSIKANRIYGVDSIQLGGVWYKTFSGGGGGGGTILDTTINWSVLDAPNTPPAIPVMGDIYLVGNSPTGVYIGHSKQIATFGGVVWTYQTATVGDLLYNATTSQVSKFNGTAWVIQGKAIIHQGGDTYAGPIFIGPLDNNYLSLKTNNKDRFVINADGSAKLKAVGGIPQLTLEYDYTSGIYPFVAFGDASTRIGGDVGGMLIQEYSGNINFKVSTTGVNLLNMTSGRNIFSRRLSINSLGNPPDNSAWLDVNSTKYGFLPPRVTGVQMAKINRGVAAGTIVSGGTGFASGTYPFIGLQNSSFDLTAQEIVSTNGVVTGGVVTTINIGSTTRQVNVGDSLNIITLSGGSGFRYVVTSVIPPATGLVVYNTDSAALCVYNGSAWVKAGSGGGVTTFAALTGKPTTHAGYGITDTLKDVLAAGNGLRIDTSSTGGVTTGTISLAGRSVQLTSGTAYTAVDSVSRVIVNPSVKFATYTFTLIAAPYDGQTVIFKFGGTITSGNPVVTSLSVLPNSGQSIVQYFTPVSASSGDRISYSYNLSNTTWYRN